MRNLSDLPEATQPEPSTAGSKTCVHSLTPGCLSYTRSIQCIWLRALQRLCWVLIRRPPGHPTCFFTSGDTISALPRGGLFSGYRLLIGTFPKGPGTSEHRGSGTLVEQTGMPGWAEGLLVPKQLRWLQGPVLPHIPPFHPGLANS